MRHHSNKVKFGREKNQRHALMKSLARSLVIHKKIETTLPKAKALRPYVEKIVTNAKKNTLSSRRGIISKLGGPKEAKIVIDDIASKYKERNGGYIRITKIGARKADATEMAIIEFV